MMFGFFCIIFKHILNKTEGNVFKRKIARTFSQLRAFFLNATQIAEILKVDKELTYEYNFCDCYNLCTFFRVVWNANGVRFDIYIN